MRCPICGEEHPNDVPICPNTGEQLKKMCLNQDCSYYRERIFDLGQDNCPCCGQPLFTKYHGFVDLGLSVKWGAYNIGACCDDEPGDFYAWGSLVPNMSYSWKSRELFDPNKNLTSNEDIASVNWGDKWRIPTKGEWDELQASCNSDWIYYYGFGHGIRFTSKIKGFEGNSIFLPACGFKSNCQPKVHNRGTAAFYWSSSPVKGSYYSYCFKFSEIEDIFGSSDYRGLAFSIRPVIG